MRKQEVWTVISLTLRKNEAHVQLGMLGPAPKAGPTFTVPVDEAPRLYEQVQLTYVWGQDHTSAAP